MLPAEELVSRVAPDIRARGSSARARTVSGRGGLRRLTWARKCPVRSCAHEWFRACVSTGGPGSLCGDLRRMAAWNPVRAGVKRSRLRRRAREVRPAWFRDLKRPKKRHTSLPPQVLGAPLAQSAEQLPLTH